MRTSFKEVARLATEADELLASNPGYFGVGYRQPEGGYVSEALSWLDEGAPEHQVLHLATVLQQRDEQDADD